MIKDYLTLCKPRVVMLMVVTSIVGMHLATSTYVPIKTLFWGNLGISLAACSAAVLNHLLDRHIDLKMSRTNMRPVATGRVTPKRAIVFAFILGSLALASLLLFVNKITAFLTVVTLFGYAIFYTVYLKRATPQNIVIGGLAGAMPPLLGWCAVTGMVDPYGLLLVLIIFIWTPPHFWALAIYRVNDYANAKIPMLPNTHGIKFTKLCILLYTLLMLPAVILPYLVGMTGIVYLALATTITLYFIALAWKLFIAKDNKLAYRLFNYSIFYLGLLFLGLLLDHYWGRISSG